MEISLLSEKRGIYAIYQGIEKGYIIWSSFYGVVAISKEIIDKEVGNINEDNLMHYKTILNGTYAIYNNRGEVYFVKW